MADAADDPALSDQNHRHAASLYDASLKVLIREIESDHWLDFIWYFDDTRLTRKVFSLSSPRIANKLMNDFSVRWQGVNLDSATEMQLGRRAILQVLKTLHQLADEGQIFIQNRKYG